MDFGVVLQANPPAWSVIEQFRRAEMAGFTHGWTFDSHLLWQEPFVIYSQVLSATHTLKVGPMVTNPSTRDWTVTASMFATLNDMFGNRTVCGIGRGDSAVRVGNKRPASVGELREAIVGIRELANGRSVAAGDVTIRIPWSTSSDLEVWVAGYGPKVLGVAGELGDGFILQVADPAIVEWSTKAVRRAAESAGRDPDAVSICVAAPAYVGDDVPHQREQCRWFGGMVGNHVADLIQRYGQGEAIPAALSDYVSGRQDYDYNWHGRAGNPTTHFVPDEVIDRFCLLGPDEAHVARLEELVDLGVDQFALYLQHDAIDSTMEAYGRRVLPRINARGAATS